jgi:hypothetical protein
MIVIPMIEKISYSPEDAARRPMIAAAPVTLDLAWQEAAHEMVGIRNKIEPLAV